MAGSDSSASEVLRIPLRPGNRSRANAYPAAALVSTWATMTHTARIAVFSRTRPYGSASTIAV